MIVSIIMMLGFPYLFLYSRNEKWNTQSLKKSLFTIMSFIFLIGFIISNTNDNKMFFYSFITTPIYFKVENYFNSISNKKHNRDFYLWLNYSDDVHGIFATNEKNSKFKMSDKVLSITLLTLIILLSVLGAVLFGKDGLYDKLMN